MALRSPRRPTRRASTSFSGRRCTWRILSELSARCKQQMVASHMAWPTISLRDCSHPWPMWSLAASTAHAQCSIGANDAGRHDRSPMILWCSRRGSAAACSEATRQRPAAPPSRSRVLCSRRVRARTPTCSCRVRPSIIGRRRPTAASWRAARICAMHAYRPALGRRGLFQPPRRRRSLSNRYATTRVARAARPPPSRSARRGGTGHRRQRLSQPARRPTSSVVASTARPSRARAGCHAC
jgi:hypothetical protein